MKRIRVRTITVFALAGLTGALLLRTSQSVQQAEDKLAELKAQVAQEQDSIRLLNAEWAYLNNPERLEKLAKQYLDLVPPQPAAIMSGPDEIPAKADEIIPPAPAAAQPVAFKPEPAKKASPPPAIQSKTSDKDFTALLKTISKGGPR